MKHHSSSNRVVIPVWVLAAVGLFVVACGPAVLAQETGKIRVLTSFMPVYCFAANVAGDLVEVECLLPAGVGPHDYHPVQSDYEKIRRADVFVSNGLGLEDWMEKLFKSRRPRKGLTRVEAAQGLKTQLIRGTPLLHLEDEGGHSHDHGDGGNPHIWLDPTLAAHAVTNILKALQNADPKNAEGYGKNAAAYVSRLQALDQELKAGLKGASGVPIVTYHDAFVYLARRYELSIIGVIETTPETPPSLRYLGSLKRAIQERKVRVIFAESQFPKAIAQQISKDTGVPLGMLDTLETPANGVMEPGSYEAGMRANLKALQAHLQ
ncbi:MAG: zinc ABC transporter substrate-binding protein [Verrucomicrobia bacterium]|nr:zinc ABC transporter substrate-binding protein [Verrucomicrobiota bacterium]